MPGLDGLRAISVLGVIAYHLEYDWAAGGFLGVDVFFVLSGYLITSLLLVEWRTTGTVALAAFWARRVRRILPAVATLLLAVALWAALAVPADQLARLRADALWTLGFGLNWHLIGTGRSYFDLFAPPSPLRHLWSLAIEEQFYAIWPIVLVVALRVARGARALPAVLLVAGLVATTTAMASRYSAIDPSRAYYGTDTHAVGLLMGALLALALEGRRVSARWLLAASGPLATAIVVAALVIVSDRDAQLYDGGLVVFSAATALVVAATVARTPIAAILGLPPLPWIGRISYGLYLWHWPVQLVLTPEATGLEAVGLDVIRVATTFALASTSFVLIENPIRRATLPPRRVLVGGGVAGAAVAGAILASTTGAVAPPDYYRATGPDEPEVAVEVTGGGRTVAIIGDSVARSLVPGLAEVLGKRGFRVVSATLPGCGLAVRHRVANVDRPWDDSETCTRVARRLLERITRHRPDLVVWPVSSWDTGTRIVDGRLVPAATRDGERALGASLDWVRRRLTKHGARIALLTLPPQGRPVLRRGAGSHLRRLARFNRLLTDWAQARPRDVTLVDLAALVCPDPPACSGSNLLRADGVHFSPKSARWVARTLLGDVLAALPTHAAR